jgi:Mn-dependent DtxR family transcriptional regulator
MGKGKKKKETTLPGSIAKCATAMETCFHHRKNVSPGELAAAAKCSPEEAEASLKEMRKMRMVEANEAGYRLTANGRIKVRAATAA